MYFKSPFHKRTMRLGKINKHLMKAFIEKKYIWEKPMGWKVFYRILL